MKAARKGQYFATRQAAPSPPPPARSESLSVGPNGQFLGHRRVLTIDEQKRALEVYLAKANGKLSPELRAIAINAWYTAMAFAKVADFEGFDAALETLQEVAPRT